MKRNNLTLNKIKISKIFEMRFFCFIALTILSIGSNTVYASTDPYPKNPKIDVLNYIFDITLSDASD